MSLIRQPCCRLRPVRRLLRDTLVTGEPSLNEERLREWKEYNMNMEGKECVGVVV